MGTVEVESLDSATEEGVANEDEKFNHRELLLLCSAPSKANPFWFEVRAMWDENAQWMGGWITAWGAEEWELTFVLTPKGDPGSFPDFFRGSNSMEVSIWEELLRARFLDSATVDSGIVEEEEENPVEAFLFK